MEAGVLGLCLVTGIIGFIAGKVLERKRGSGGSSGGSGPTKPNPRPPVRPK